MTWYGFGMADEEVPSTAPTRIPPRVPLNLVPSVGGSFAALYETPRRGGGRLSTPLWTRRSLLIAGAQNTWFVEGVRRCPLQPLLTSTGVNFVLFVPTRCSSSLASRNSLYPPTTRLSTTR